MVYINLFTAEKVPVYTQETRLDTYLYATDLPVLNEFTICLWHFGLPSDLYGGGCWFSFATQCKLSGDVSIRTCGKTAITKL